MDIKVKFLTRERDTDLFQDVASRRKIYARRPLGRASVEWRPYHRFGITEEDTLAVGTAITVVSDTGKLIFQENILRNDGMSIADKAGEFSNDLELAIAAQLRMNYKLVGYDALWKTAGASDGRFELIRSTCIQTAYILGEEVHVVSHLVEHTPTGQRHMEFQLMDKTETVNYQTCGFLCSGVLPKQDLSGLRLPGGLVSIEAYSDELARGKDIKPGEAYPTAILAIEAGWLESFIAPRKWKSLDSFLETYTLDEVTELRDEAIAAKALAFEYQGDNNRFCLYERTGISTADVMAALDTISAYSKMAEKGK